MKNKFVDVNHYPCSFPRRGEPDDYIAWHEWAAKKYNKGWRQKECPKCHLYIFGLCPEKKKKINPNPHEQHDK